MKVSDGYPYQLNIRRAPGFCSALEKVAIDIRDASVMFVRGRYLSTLRSFQNQCRVNILSC